MSIKFATSSLLATILGLTSIQAIADSSTYTAYVWQRGTTVAIPTARVIELCADGDGCDVRIAMYNWDGSGRTASRQSLFYYNATTRTWRAEAGDPQGTVGNNVTEHVLNAWSCYLTDGYYTGWTNHGDINTGFAVLSWNQYTATCSVTFED